MKKYLLTILAMILISSTCLASEEQRKISSGDISTPTVITSVPSILFDVSCVVTTAGGWCAVYNATSTNNPAAADKLAELREATANNSKQVSMGVDGIKASKGITVWMNNATAIITYR